jgi:hypothetical protein
LYRSFAVLPAEISLQLTIKTERNYWAAAVVFALVELSSLPARERGRVCCAMRALVRSLVHNKAVRQVLSEKVGIVYLLKLLITSLHRLKAYFF